MLHLLKLVVIPAILGKWQQEPKGNIWILLCLVAAFFGHLSILCCGEGCVDVRDTVQELLLFFFRVVSWNWTPIFRLGGKCLYPLSQRGSPRLRHFKKLILCVLHSLWFVRYGIRELERLGAGETTALEAGGWVFLPLSAFAGHRMSLGPFWMV